MIHPERLEHLYKKLSSATLVFTIGDSIEVEAEPSKVKVVEEIREQEGLEFVGSRSAPTPSYHQLGPTTFFFKVLTVGSN
jgi:hypothetical protein